MQYSSPLHTGRQAYKMTHGSQDAVEVVRAPGRGLRKGAGYGSPRSRRGSPCYLPSAVPSQQHPPSHARWPTHPFR